MKALFGLVFLLWVMSLGSGAQTTVTFYKSLEQESDLFTTDPIGNIYLVKNRNVLVKYSPDGDSLAVFNEVVYGKISRIDAINPLRVLVYYADYGRIVILDNMLSQKNVLNLRKINRYNIPCIANSADGNIWLMDAGTGELLKIDDRLDIKFQSPLRNILDFAVMPVGMQESNRELYLVDTANGVLHFDRFGFYVNKYPFYSSSVQVLYPYILFRSDSTFHSYETKTLYEQTLLIPEAISCLGIRLERDQLYIRRKNRIDLYKINL